MPTFLANCAKTDDESPADFGTNFSGTYQLTADEQSRYDTNQFLNINNGITMIKDGATHRAFGRRCPHEGGLITAISATSAQCGKHNDQFYDKTGLGNGARTTASLTALTVNTATNPYTITG